MTIYIDAPMWPGHGRMWSHLVSDASYEELHTFAEALGCPRRAFDRDHYDLPSTRYETAVAAGAREVGSKELLRRLTEAGLRRPKRRGPQAEGTRQPERSSPCRS
ncbi:DUF4031 domain-containing protein [Streptomyces xiaopingdaonensis]|uniref:DUF4031 domain-containing protein n=1 Tax=Streptomyces xiaopingdaonensis TaxID=1565415 RepID=UPI00030788C9|nr:DUF4031 domain-containing protein [Streptomyces xiaopingdaonensis]